MNLAAFVSRIIGRSGEALGVAGVSQGDGTGAILVSLAATGDQEPYNAAAGGQTAKVSSFVGIAGFNGTTVDPILTVNGGQVEATIYSTTGVPLAISAGGAASVTLVGGSGTTATQSTTNTPVPANASPVVIKSTAGRLFGVTITTTGITPLVLTDGVGGTAIFVTIASPAVGYFPIAGGNVFNTSLNVPGSATNPAFVAHYA